MQTNAIEDDETVRQKLAQIRDRILKGEDFAAIASVVLGRPGLRDARRRPRLDRPGLVRARVREAGRRARRQRDQRAVQDAVRLAHRAAARPPHLRRLRGRHAQQVRGRRCARRARTRKTEICGCAACATKPTSNTACEPSPARSRPLAVTTGEPAGIGPDLCAAIAGTPLELPRRAARRPPRCSAGCAARKRLMDSLPDYDPARPRAAGSRCCTCRSRPRARRAASMPRTPATCSTCSTAPSTVASPASSTRW